MNKQGAGLSAWQLTMLALGTVIGGSFFLGSAVAIRAAGPAVIIAFGIGGALVYAILFALSEMTVADSSPGSFRTFAERAYGPAAGFIVGWVYWTGLALAMSSEAIAAAALLRIWRPEFSLPLLGSLIIIIVTLLNLFGADRLSKLESGLAAVKLIAIAGFVVLSLVIISGQGASDWSAGAGEVFNQPLLPAGIGGLAGSLLIVMFSYAGFEVIGLAASEAGDPERTVPRAITYTVISLVGLYVTAVAALLLLVPTGALTVNQSPLVTALTAWNFYGAGNIVNFVLVTAILSTMLAAMFGLGRMIRSLADEGHAPRWLRDEGNIPYKGIGFSGAAMLAGLGLGLLLPEQVYLFLVSSGGFALLFSYLVILLTHYKLRRRQGCPPQGKCQLPGFPVSSWLALATIGLIMVSMPLIPGQGAGMVAGLGLVALFWLIFRLTGRAGKLAGPAAAIGRDRFGRGRRIMAGHQFEAAEEVTAEPGRPPEQRGNCPPAEGKK